MWNLYKTYVNHLIVKDVVKLLLVSNEIKADIRAYIEKYKNSSFRQLIATSCCCYWDMNTYGTKYWLDLSRTLLGIVNYGDSYINNYHQNAYGAAEQMVYEFFYHRLINI